MNYSGLIRAKTTIELFARNINTSIISDNKELPRDNYVSLLSDYSFFRSDNKLKEGFYFLSGFYIFLISGGYNTSENRRETDINEIDRFLDEYDC